MAGHAVKTKHYWKDTPLILVDEGHSYAGLEQTCAELRANGFRDVRIVEGGLKRWRLKVAPLRHDPRARRQLDWISPAEFFPERHIGNWRVVDIDSLSQDGGVQEFVAAVRRTLHQGASAPVGDLRFLLVSSEAERYHSLQAHLSDIEREPVYFLQGGHEGYAAFVGQRTALASYQHKLPAKGASGLCGN